MDNSVTLLELREGAEHVLRDGDPVPDRLLLRPVGYEGDAMNDDPTGLPLVIALIFVTSALSGFVVGYALGPLAFWVMR